MFDIGFSELVLVFIVGLVVLGPKRLPIAIRTVMGWVRTIRGLAANVQSELAQELKLQELQESIKKAEQLNVGQFSPELSKTVEELKKSAEKMKADIDSAKGEVQSLAEQSAQQIRQAADNQTESVINSAENMADLAVQPDVASEQTAENAELSPEEMAILAEEELQEKLAAYYPPDDAATPTANQQDNKHVS